ncbi:DUF4876 domain-containing protein [uncultured Draconibacterium sp.]|uniref:DUF4876 domain-containing protein n=1 Tax=uncultured Draconibacterium sp. TaxID=1573823 RepID=UPI0029BFC990|nr:DUF4876 domain-containing protein [uncultured Draconibacterium sp.]
MLKNTQLFSFLFIVILIVSLSSCKNEYDNLFQTTIVNVQLNYPEDFETVENVIVTLTNTSNNTTFIDSTNSNGTVTFDVPLGLYQASVSETRQVSLNSYIFTGSTNISVSESYENSAVTTIDLSVSKSASILIKELYIGGCQKDDGSGTFRQGQYMILYNNSVSSVSLDNLCFGMVYPYNSNSTNYFYEDGAPSYETENWIPAAQGIWYFPDGVNLASGEQIVVAFNSAIDNTITYSQSINFANSEFYTTYDIDVYSNELYYPVPSSSIPTSHYLSAVKFGSASAWSLSVSSPAFFLFSPQGETPAEFANNVNNLGYYNGSANQGYTKVPNDWVIDAAEVYRQGDDNLKRLPAAIDAGYIVHTNSQGYALYRNVNKEATLAIPGNEGKIIENYSGGTTDIADGSTDPSGIDAEASIANGARIIYSDTNSSTNDFHQRKKASLRH